MTVVLMQGAPASDLAKQAYDKMGRGIEIIMYRTAGGAVDAADVIIDAVFGFSFHGRLPSVMEPLFARAAENKKAFHISVDIPSGAVCDTGAVEGACFKADLTVTFTAMKPAGVVYPAAGFGGMTVVRQVGIKEEHLEMLPCDTESVLLGNICPLFPKRDPEGHIRAAFNDLRQRGHGRCMHHGCACGAAQRCGTFEHRHSACAVPDLGSRRAGGNLHAV